MIPDYSVLSVERYELSVFLGWPDEERAQKQNVYIDIEIQFDKISPGFTSDNLDDTFCYATFLTGLQKKFDNRPIKLIERLTYEIFTELKSALNLPAKVKVRVTKYPEVPGLKGGASFTCMDT